MLVDWLVGWGEVTVELEYWWPLEGDEAAAAAAAAANEKADP